MPVPIDMDMSMICEDYLLGYFAEGNMFGVSILEGFHMQFFIFSY